MARPVPRLGRILDLVGVGFFLVGGALYGWAWLQLQGLAAEQPLSEGLGFAALQRFVHLSRLSRIGLILMAVGAAFAVVAAVTARLLRDRESTSG